MDTLERHLYKAGYGVKYNEAERVICNASVNHIG